MQRAVGWVRAEGDPLANVHCPAGHHIPRRRVIELHEGGIVACDYRAPSGPARTEPCAQMLLVLIVARLVRSQDDALDRRVFVASVSPDEARRIRTDAKLADLYDALDWLGCRYMPLSVAREHIAR